MFASLPSALREHGLNADVRTLLLIQKASIKGLCKTLGDVYAILRAAVVKDPKELGPFTKAFYQYFLQIDFAPGDTLLDAILRSETFKKWREDNLDRFGDDLDVDELVDTFLSEVHLTSYDIKEILDGQEIWNNDSGDVEDEDGLDTDGESRLSKLEQMADYSGLSLEELLERMREVMKQQKGKHQGGSHWIGTGGISPYGHGGAAKDGIRVGGTGGGKMARMILNDRKYFPVDRDRTINDDNIDAALSALNGVMEETAETKLDLPKTIKDGIKRGGLFLPELEHHQHKKLQVLLLIDNGGYSMDPFVRMVQQLFRKMKTRFAHDMETYYFHNTIYDRVYTDAARRKSLPLKSLLDKDPAYRVFIVGDASMAPYELSKSSMDTYRKMSAQFSRIAWLNPEKEKYWHYVFSIQVIRQLIPMYQLSPKGIEEAVREMNRKSI